jgi:putative intracellular protease/amidase
MMQKKKILVVLTNTTQFQVKPEATGLWLGEATEFVSDMQQAGFAVDYVSPQGGYVPLDPRSLKYADAQAMAMYQDPEFQRRALTASLAPNQVHAEDYTAIYYTGGHGVMFDFPDSQALQDISRTIYRQGGYLTSVCHGIAGLLNLQDDNGQYIIAGKRITGFTTTEEILSSKRRMVPFLNEHVAKDHGAIFQKVRAFKSYAVTDGRMITGQNPWSPHAVANALLDAIGN